MRETSANRFLPAAVAIFLISLTVRLVHIFQIRRAPFYSLLMGDAQSYHAWARQIAGGDWIGSEVFYQAPLYPYFLGLVYTLLGEAPMTVRLCQAVIGSLACAWLAFAAARLFSKAVGIAAGLMLAFYAPAIFFDGLIQKPVLDAFLLCVALALVSGLIVHPARVWAWLWVGMTIGCLTLSRENAVVLAVAILLWLLWDQRHMARQRLARAGLLLAGLAIVLLPVAARNKIVGGEFHLTTSQFGPNFYIGNNETSTGTYQPLRSGHGDPKYERQDATELAEQATGSDLTPAEVSRYWTQRALDYIRMQPEDWLELTGRKIVLIFNAAEIADTEDQQSYADWSTVLRITSRVWHFGMLAPLALFGIWATWPRRYELAPLYLLPAAYLVTLIAFAVMARYRYLLVPFLIIFASAGLVQAGHFLRRRPRRLASGLAAVLLFAVFCNWPIYSMAEMRAITQSNVGTELQAQGKVDEAIVFYRAALARDANDAVTRSNLGAALAARGQLDEAVAEYRTALNLSPNDADIHYNLANALAAQGKLVEAVAEFREALRIDPGLAEAYLNLGNVLVTLGQAEEAITVLQRALAIKPDFANARINLANAHNDRGVMLAQRNQLDEAVSHFRQAIRLAPDFAEAHSNLAMALQIQGKR